MSFSRLAFLLASAAALRAGPPATTTRREALSAAAGLALAATTAPAAARARAPAAADDDELPPLPPAALRALDQYAPTLQLAADYYVFALADALADPMRWGQVGAAADGSRARTPAFRR